MNSASKQIGKQLGIIDAAIEYFESLRTEMVDNLPVENPTWRDVAKFARAAELTESLLKTLNEEEERGQK